MSKDYKSFSAAAKSRFREMAKTLGYQQISGTFYVKDRGQWYESFALQASSYGNDFFYINYGVIVPNLWPPFEENPDLKCLGYVLHGSLHDDYSQGFANGSKAEIEKSASIALQRYQEQAVPWFNEISDLAGIAEIYFENSRFKMDENGHLPYGNQLRAANYGLLLRLAEKYDQALRWLQEAERLMSLPIYHTKDGRVVHEREKHARICKPYNDEVEQFNKIKAVIKALQKSR